MLHLAEQPAPARRPRLHVGLAQCESEIREAQKLRYRIFAVELGAVLQVRDADAGAVAAIVGRHGLAGRCRRVGRVVAGDTIRVTAGDEVVGAWPRPVLHRAWSAL